MSYSSILELEITPTVRPYRYDPDSLFPISRSPLVRQHNSRHFLHCLMNRLIFSSNVNLISDCSESQVTPVSALDCWYCSESQVTPVSALDCWYCSESQVTPVSALDCSYCSESQVTHVSALDWLYCSESQVTHVSALDWWYCSECQIISMCCLGRQNHTMSYALAGVCSDSVILWNDRM